LGWVKGWSREKTHLMVVYLVTQQFAIEPERGHGKKQKFIYKILHLEVICHGYFRVPKRNVATNGAVIGVQTSRNFLTPEGKSSTAERNPLVS